MLYISLRVGIRNHMLINWFYVDDIWNNLLELYNEQRNSLLELYNEKIIYCIML